MFNLKIKTQITYILVNKVYSSLSSFKPEMPDGFWEFNARAAKKFT